ncbi:MAG TPA: formimidoylglutamate deiminase [Actinomycetales bacterium]|nr:formimidoylglutamate deiminase [Actinomycetales bacterium]
MTTWWSALAWLDDGPVASVRLTERDGVLTGVDVGVLPGPDDVRLAGLVLPGFANAHSHAFHRALRGRTHADGGTFWTWREAMYSVARRLDPDSYLALARAVYAEMALAGVTAVGEFHYLHHGDDGRPYAEPNAMAEALRQAATEAGVRLTLLDTCYLAGGLDAGGYRPLDPVQRRFADADVGSWAERVAGIRPDANTRVGAAIHSVRAVEPRDLPAVADVAGPLHVHLSEQPAENEACLAVHGVTPTRLLADAGVLGPRTTAVHATHLTDDDVDLLGAGRTSICLCPTTERDLADGVGPARALADAGSPLCVGSDQHAVVDLLAEVRGVEMHERLTSGRRGRIAPAALVGALTRDGHAAIGWPECGRLVVGAPADLVAVRLDTVRTAGIDPAQIVLAATAADVDTVVVGGRVVVSGGRHRLGDVGAMLSRAIAPWGTEVHDHGGGVG